MSLAESVKRIVKRMFPELSAGHHLAKWGVVTALPELPTQDGERLSDPFYPRYACDIELVDENGTKTGQILQAVPLPVSGLGELKGRLEPPEIGAVVEIAFAYGRPDRPFIRCVLPFGFNLPSIKAGESKYQHSEKVYQLVDDAGNFDRKTDQSDILECLNQRIKVLENRIVEISGNLTESISGNKSTTAKIISMNGGTGVITCESICPYTGQNHVDGSTTVMAGK